MHQVGSLLYGRQPATRVEAQECRTDHDSSEEDDEPIAEHERPGHEQREADQPEEVSCAECDVPEREHLADRLSALPASVREVEVANGEVRERHRDGDPRDEERQVFPADRDAGLVQIDDLLGGERERNADHHRIELLEEPDRLVAAGFLDHFRIFLIPSSSAAVVTGPLTCSTIFPLRP